MDHHKSSRVGPSLHASGCISLQPTVLATMSSVHESTSSITVYGGQHTSAGTITVTDMANKIGDSIVVLLLFMRFDKFKTLAESDHLHSCCEALTQNRISTELRDHGFDSGSNCKR